jgi:uncharacterized repeat protein (TIGR01451 family)
MYLQNNVSRLAIILFCSLLFSFTTALADTDLSVSITDLPDSIIPGQDVTLNLKVMNNGPSPASNVVVSGTLPPGASFRGYSGAGWKCGPSGSGGACTLSTLNVGKAPDLNVVVKSPVTSGNITFPAIVSSNSTDTDTSNNSYSTIISLVGETGDFCVRDYRSGAVCVANDVRIEALTVVSVVESCVTGVVGETEVVFETLVSADGSPDRYDVGLFLALDGGSARDGDSCFHDYLEPPLTTTPTYGDKNLDTIPDVFDGPWWDDDGDTCGDIETNTQVIKTLPPLRFKCIDNNGDGSADVSVCTSWDNNDNTACNSIAEAFPGTNSKCSCAGVELGIVPAPELTVTKTPPTQTVAFGGTATFTITLDSNTFLSGVIVNDPQCDTLTGPVGDDGDSVLETTETWTYTCTVNNVTADFTNSVTVDATSPNGPVSDSDTADVTVLDADLSITKTDSIDPVIAGNNITYTVTVNNAGPGDAQNVVVTDTLPAGVTLVSTAGCTEDPNGVPTCSPGTITAGGSAQYTVTVTVDSDTSGTITNNVSVTADTSDPDSNNNSTSEDTTVNAEADLVITKSDNPDPVIAGNSLTYTVNVQNNGPSDAQNVVVTDTLPAEVTLVSTAGCAEDPNGVPTCTLGTITAGGSAQYTVTVNVNSDTSGTITNNVSVSSSTTLINTGDDSASEDTTVNAEADLAITKSDNPDPVIAGNSLTYTIDVQNNGPSDATNVVVTDTLPAGVTFVSTAGCAEDPNGLPTCTLGTITAGGSVQYTVTVLVNSGTSGTITNNVSVSSSTTLINTGDDSASEDTTVNASADLSITKTDSIDPVIAGNNITYTVTVNNAGPGDAQNVVVTDTLPAGVTFVSTAGCAEDPNGIPTCSLGTISAGGSAQYTVTVTVDSGTTGTITNNVSVTSDTSDPDSNNNSTSEDTTVNAEADLVITKSDNPDPVIAGNSLTYTVNVQNNGPSDAQNALQMHRM